ncbi:MAG TPA: hypothetical protein DGG95_15620 [Cytophagales bacterium]|jgi:hypothetical protein|nr:hypothetical protein [Cytophagales bacterium]
MKNQIKLFVIASICFVFSAITLKAQTAVYVCSTNGACGYCYGNSSVANCAYNKCIQEGGKTPLLVLSVARKGYGAIAVGRSATGAQIVGAAAGYQSQEEANRRALQECANRGGNNARISDTFLDR